MGSKIFGLPAPVVIGGSIVILYLLYRWNANKQAAAATAATTGADLTGASQVPSFTGTTGGGGVGLGGGTGGSCPAGYALDANGVCQPSASAANSPTAPPGYYYDPTSGQYQPMPGTQNNVTPGSLAAEINAAPPGVPVPGLSSREQNAIFAASNPSLFQGPGGAYSGGPTGDPALYAYFQSLNAAKK